MYQSRMRQISMAVLAMFVLSGCLKGEESDSSAGSPNPPTNSSPTISGVPASVVAIGQAYRFVPNATDNDGDSLTFSIQNRPTWASFDSSNGEISGTPTLADVGTTQNIVVSVSDGTESTSLPPFSITVENDENNENDAPTIAGTPQTSVAIGATYSFTPVANDPDGNTLAFSIQNQPAWATFDSATGTLSGQPAAGAEGVYPNILISVSDGTDSASLAPFSIQVNAIANGSVSLSWVAPTQNDDGSALNNLAGFEIRYGTASNSYDQSVRIDNESVTNYVVENLQPATYYFVAVAFTSTGVESILSNEVSRTVN